MSIDLRNVTGASYQEEVRNRRNLVSQELSLDLSRIEGDVDDSWNGKNIENCVGSVQIPLGVAGPLIYYYHGKKREKYVPLATTEGALVASIARGMKAITAADTCTVFVDDVGMTRAPVYQTKSLEDARAVAAFCTTEIDQIKDHVVNFSGESRVRLKEIQSFVRGKLVFTRQVFDTQEAMGMNMVTNASLSITDFLQRNFQGIKLTSLSSNVCSDKKDAAINRILGRAKQVSLEITIPEEVIESVLKTTSQDFYTSWMHKHIIGSKVAELTSYNAHAANCVAAIFAATGQDLAHVVEASMADVFVEKIEQGLYLSVSMPDVPAGVIGGGTSNPSQKTGLKILGLGDVKPGDSKELAAVVGVTVLAGELSLIAALSRNQLACAHQKLGRGK